MYFFAKALFGMSLVLYQAILTCAELSQRSPAMELLDEVQVVDIIVIGGGTAGSVVAARLSDEFPDLSILVVEAGVSNVDNANVSYPALYRFNLAPDSSTCDFWPSQREPQLADRAITVATGAVLGGSSSVNAAVYARGQLVDFESWNSKGWSGKELIPLLTKLETYYGPDPSGTHGTDGPVQVSRGTYEMEALTDDYIQAANKTGYESVVDAHDLQSINVVSPLRRYASPSDGRRQDAASRYLQPRLEGPKNKNLHLMLGVQVNRILFGQDNEAIGIEYKQNPRFQLGTPAAVPFPGNSTFRTARARKLVVMSSGSFGTPLLLERSGVGDPGVLDRAGVKTTHVLQGVGLNYQDHPVVSYAYRSKITPTDTVDSLFNGLLNRTQLIESDDPILSWTGVDALARVRPAANEVATLGEQYEGVWAQDFANTPSKTLFLISLVNGLFGYSNLLSPDKSFFSLITALVHPRSRGHVHITGPRLTDQVDHRTGFLSDDEDFDITSQLWAYKKQRAMARRMQNFDGEVEATHPVFPEGSGAAIGLPSSEELRYSAEDDEAIVTFLRARAGPNYHPLGTCKMAPEADCGVVDERLNVHGVKNLKIADMSIVPTNVAANTMNTALLIGERAAELIIEELRAIQY